MAGVKLYPTREAAEADAAAMLGWPTPAVLPQCEYDEGDHDPADGRCWAPGYCEGWIVRVVKTRSESHSSWVPGIYVLEDDRVDWPS